MKRLVEWLLRNQIAVLFGLGVLLFVSAWAFVELPKDVFPNAAFPRFQIIADAGFASLDTTELGMTRPLEEALKGVPDVQEVRSVTERGTSTIDLYLRWGADLNYDYQVAQVRVGEARPKLPPGASVSIIRMTTSTYPMSEYGLWSDRLNQKQLFTLAKYSMLPRLLGIDGLARLTFVGGQEPEVKVALDPKRLVEFNLDAGLVETAIDDANKADFIGKIGEGVDSWFVVGGTKLGGAADLKTVVVASRMGRPVLLGDVAQVTDSGARLRRVVTVNGHPGAFIDVLKQPTADALKVSQSMDARMAALVGGIAGLHFVRWDLSDFVRQSLQGIFLDILIGVLVILIIATLILRRLRYALPVILVMPLVLGLEFLVMRLLGQTVNIMTLGGLSAAIGIIADNAIVLTEHHIHFWGRPRQTNALAAAMEDIVPVTLWATLVTLIVFAPLTILSGVPGLFFGPLAVTLASTILLSLAVSVLVLPIFLKHLVENRPPLAPPTGGLFTFAEKRYHKALDGVLRHPKTLAASVGMAMVLALLVFTKVPSGFLPEWDEGDIVLDVIQPYGMGMAESNRLSCSLEAALRAFPEVDLLIRKTGTAQGQAFLPPNISEFQMQLSPERSRSTFAVMDAMRVRLTQAFPDAQFDFHQRLPDRLGDLTGEAKPIVVNVRAVDADAAALWAAAVAVQAALEKVDGLNGVEIGMPPSQPELEVAPRKSRLALLGLSAGDAYHYARLALFGEVATRLSKGLRLIPVRVDYQGNFRSQPASIGSIPVFTAGGGVVPLRTLAAWHMESRFPEIHHVNSSVVINVNAEISGRSLSAVVADVQAALARLRCNGVTFELAGNYKNQKTSFHELLRVLAGSVVLILAALFFVFESWRTALAVFFGTLASGSFVVFGLALSRVEFDVSSFTGLITVMGIVVNNGILVLEFVERERLPGVPIAAALRRGCAQRFRPVLITNLAAIAGFLPMALNLGSGGEVLRPFSVAMISGLVGSMAFSLLVMPVFYLLLRRKTWPSD